MKITVNTSAIVVEIHLILKNQETIILTKDVMPRKQGNSDFQKITNYLTPRSVVREIHSVFTEIPKLR